MEALIPGMLLWICLQIGCEPPPPPDIMSVSQEVLLERVYGDKPHEGAYVCRLYDDKTQTIWLPHECRADDIFNQSTLLHELVHHVQTVTEMAYPCLAARESLAYGLQAQWLQEDDMVQPPARQPREGGHHRHLLLAGIGDDPPDELRYRWIDWR